MRPRPLSPEEIRHPGLARTALGRRGYAAEAVDALLDRIADEVAVASEYCVGLVAENARLKAALRDWTRQQPASDAGRAPALGSSAVPGGTAQPVATASAAPAAGPAAHPVPATGPAGGPVGGPAGGPAGRLAGGPAGRLAGGPAGGSTRELVRDCCAARNMIMMRLDAAQRSTRRMGEYVGGHFEQVRLAATEQSREGMDPLGPQASAMNT
ncbi:MAG: DivIVA domain-containing protein, partial [Micromonosporaceae bacterium]|nr:DivIVA domain-containing protein [Micromonosporaceae bacterium]